MTQYIDKNAVVAEIERRQKEEVSYCENGSFASWADENHYFTLETIESFIDTLEVKEVDLGNEFDLNKEIDEQIRLLGGVHKLDNNSKRWYTGPYEELFHFAKHFFELGLNTKKEK